MILGNIYEPGIFPGSNSKKEEAKLGKEKLVVILCGSMMFRKNFEDGEQKPPMEELTMVHNIKRK